MKKSIQLVLAAMSFAAFLLPATAAKSPTMTYCSGLWAELKEAGTTRGQTWPQFWSQCSKEYAADGARSRTARSAYAEARPCRPSLSNLWTCPETSGSSARKAEARPCRPSLSNLWTCPETSGSSARKAEARPCRPSLSNLWTCPKTPGATTRRKKDTTRSSAACCKVCRRGQACGNTCIDRDDVCHVPRGCACDG
jgi:hypothetical protein